MFFQKGYFHPPTKAASSSTTSQLHAVCNEAIRAADNQKSAMDVKRASIGMDGSEMSAEMADDEDAIEAVRVEIQAMGKDYFPMYEKKEKAEKYLEIKASDCLGTRANCTTGGRFRPLSQPTQPHCNSNQNNQNQNRNPSPNPNPNPNPKRNGVWTMQADVEASIAKSAILKHHMVLAVHTSDVQEESLRVKARKTIRCRDIPERARPHNRDGIDCVLASAAKLPKVLEPLETGLSSASISHRINFKIRRQGSLSRTCIAGQELSSFVSNILASLTLTLSTCQPTLNTVPRVGIPDF